MIIRNTDEVVFLVERNSISLTDVTCLIVKIANSIDQIC